MQSKEVPIDITFGHFESRNRIELRYPEITRRRWRALASKTRHYLGSSEVLEVLAEENPDVAGDWADAQFVLDRLAFSPRPYLTLGEADNCLNFIAATCLFLKRKEMEWKQAKAFLVIMAQIAPCKLEPLRSLPVCDRKSVGVAIKSYEWLRTVIGSRPSWVSTCDIYLRWAKLAKYRGKNRDVIQLTQKLGVLCKPFRLAFEKLAPDEPSLLDEHDSISGE